jgi:predicted metal-dependent hydrolase
MKTIIIANTTYQIKLVRKSLRSIRLRLIDKNTLSVSAPFFIPEFAIANFIHQNESWITAQSAKITPSSSLLNLKNLTLLDKKYDLIIKPSSRDSLIIMPQINTIHLNTTHLSSTHLSKIISTKLKPIAVRLLEEQIHLLKHQYSFSYKKLTFRNQRSRFGSCSSSGTLSFNWQIIFFPKDKCHHIILHEAAHLAHHNHSQKFWAQLALYDPHWRLNRLWVKQKGSRFLLIK